MRYEPSRPISSAAWGGERISPRLSAGSRRRNTAVGSRSGSAYRPGGIRRATDRPLHVIVTGAGFFLGCSRNTLNDWSDGVTVAMLRWSAQSTLGTQQWIGLLESADDGQTRRATFQVCDQRTGSGFDHITEQVLAQLRFAGTRGRRHCVLLRLTKTRDLCLLSVIANRPLWNELLDRSAATPEQA